jgi:molecular chaperone DnaJ
MKRDLYRVLDINRNADLAKIKKAYRRAAKRFHPDISPGTAKQFRDAQEAYKILSDPRKRSLYDEEDLRKPPIRMSPVEATTFTQNPLALFDRFFFDFRNPWPDYFVETLVDSRRRPQSLSAEIILTQEEAENGCEISLPVQYEIVCERCHGSGRFAGFVCNNCMGPGKIERRAEIRLQIPSGVRNGLVERIPLWNSRYQEISLTLTFLVDHN